MTAENNGNFGLESTSKNTLKLMVRKFHFKGNFVLFSFSEGIYFYYLNLRIFRCRLQIYNRFLAVTCSLRVIKRQ